MSTDPLDEKLGAYAQQPLPSAPADLPTAVWRQIEGQRADTFSWDKLLSPKVALAGLAFALLVGIAPAVVLVKLQSSKQLASESLHFDVFSTELAGNVVSGLKPAQSSAHRH